MLLCNFDLVPPIDKLLPLHFLLHSRTKEQP